MREVGRNILIRKSRRWKKKNNNNRDASSRMNNHLPATKKFRNKMKFKFIMAAARRECTNQPKKKNKIRAMSRVPTAILQNSFYESILYSIDSRRAITWHWRGEERKQKHKTTNKIHSSERLEAAVQDSRCKLMKNWAITNETKCRRFKI